MTDWAKYRLVVDEGIVSGKGMEEAIREARRVCTRTTRVLPSCPPPDMRLVDLIEEVKQCRSRVIR